MSTRSLDSFTEMTVEELYERLKPIARNLMSGQSPTHTFGQGTVLLNEFFARVSRFLPELESSPEARRAVARQAAQIMCNILIDHYRGHRRQKRTGDHQRVDLKLVDGAGRFTREPVDLVSLRDALQQLGVADPPAAEVVEKRFFGGYTTAEIAKECRMTNNQVEVAWQRAKRWLARRLRDEQ